MEDKQPAPVPAPATGSSIRKNASVRSRAYGRIPSTLEALNSLQTSVRRSALAEAAQGFASGEIARPQESGWVNVLARTFFSHSADGYSPSRLVWEAVIRGLSVVGSLDLDNLGALGELMTAGDALGIRTTVSLETKVSVESYGDRELNCPGEPGVMSAIAAGFARVPGPECPAGQLIASLPGRARERNLALIANAGKLLAPLTLEYETEVVSLTPAGNATPRHIASAYLKKSAAVFPDLHDRAVFWADVLGRSPTDVEAIIAESGSLQEVLLEKLLASAPEQPRETLYPGVVQFFKSVRAAGAVPCLQWLDGSSTGERDPGRLLDDAMVWGARAVAILPDSIWNVPSTEEKVTRLAAMNNFVSAARERGLPVLIGSKMDRPRQKFMDSLDAPELAPYLRDFTDSAYWLYGHTLMQRCAGNGVTSEWAKRHFGRDFAAANAFYLEVGKKATPDAGARGCVTDAGADADPGDVLNAF